MAVANAPKHHRCVMEIAPAARSAEWGTALALIHFS
eukprot:CAMPEP_0205824206 /NCGR_PEP_ID=MMETSP0206-20130828/20001_1 /ASSEMBLY_ACC=CAM_ASM_000279 /TAXON_ID=36767 /ORGANISM="Euplotes focardii, Strain TN1" /LENGTH=35 /DNA_ID= /DNA_START= /DNA_END= /DNA_ORIENTATION=